jgi:hypothetical protein
MDISFISEAEANRLRLPIHDVSAASSRVRRATSLLFRGCGSTNCRWR